MSRSHQIVLALVFLTRLPLGRLLPPEVLPLSRAAWAFPLAGAVLGLLAGVPLWIMGTGLLPAALSVALAIWLTGALHEDALADFADAGGGRDRADRLRIMRESTIGSYGAAALVATGLVRVAALAALAALGPLALIAAAAAGRVAPVMLMRALPPARTDGLGQGAGQPSRRAVVAATLTGVLALLLGAPGPGAAALAMALIGLSVVAVSRRACRLLGGQTGDVLGASVLLAECAALVGMAALT
ncbi:adenosylcobinamide-GDP ribazoletransferase [Paracoccus marcusii]|uniref:adenosylcobinamide-GDP ribazoletransferase n=1 Tax=Paracoccus marcusii TaxID=59779 RepID=UPI0035A5B3C1